jgi:hypothetical protein
MFPPEWDNAKKHDKDNGYAPGMTAMMKSYFYSRNLEEATRALQVMAVLQQHYEDGLKAAAATGKG